MEVEDQRQELPLPVRAPVVGEEEVELRHHLRQPVPRLLLLNFISFPAEQLPSFEPSLSHLCWAFFVVVFITVHVVNQTIS